MFYLKGRFASEMRGSYFLGFGMLYIFFMEERKILGEVEN